MVSPNSQVIIDAEPANYGCRENDPERWAYYFNHILKRPMISAADLYEGSKTSSEDVLRSVRMDFRVTWLGTSTQVDYNPHDLGGIITHNAGCIVPGVTPRIIPVDVIPEYNSTPLPAILNTAQGVTYMQAFFGTTDDLKTLTSVVENISGMTVENILHSTNFRSSRQENTRRIVSFHYNSFMTQFLMDVGANHVSNICHSRAVSMIPQTKP